MILNNNMNTSDPTERFGPQWDSNGITITITIIYIIIFITGLWESIITCMIILETKEMHTATNFYLLNLCFSDLLLLVSGIPQEIYKIWVKWPYKFEKLFILCGLASEISTNANVLTITLLTIERYLAICHPFVSHQKSRYSRAKKHVALLWAVSLVLALPQVLLFDIKIHRGVHMALQIFSFFIPGIIITTLYSLIALKLYRTNIAQDNLENRLKRNIKKSSTQSTKKVILIRVAVVVTFIICRTPFHAQRLIAIYGTTDNHLVKSPNLQSIYLFMTYTSGVFYYMSTCINPIYYLIMSNNFREAFKTTILQCCCPCRSNNTNIPIARNVNRSPAANSGNSDEKKNLNLRTFEPGFKKQEELNLSSTRDEILFERYMTTSTSLREECDTQNYTHKLHITLPDNQIPVH